METKNSLLRGSSISSQEAKKALEENHIEFSQVFSNDDYQTPILFTDHGIYPYKGLSEIKQYAERNNPKREVLM
ncbi:hypothetical protein [uncultured Planktosalinus sp.]|uniref:hypothetical protein n=1 Tax=uncultured Planktosalinus sp. TaxID=1810935 RepID=UPI0030DD3112